MHFAPGSPVSLPAEEPCSSMDHGRKPSSRSFLSRLWKEESTSSLLCQEDIELAFRMFMYGLDPCGRQAQALTTRTHDASAFTSGTLSRIKDMPLEIVFEVMLYLHPTDLLSLSRTSRRMRDVLLSKSSQFVWRSSISGVRGLPPCPVDMIEPQYANLVFGQHCEFCGKAGAKDVSWTCRVRYCSSCFKAQFVTEGKLDDLISEDLRIEKFASVFPYTVLNQYHTKQPSKVLYHLPTAVRYLAELDGLVYASDVEEAIATWVKSKKESQIARIKHASLCEHWYNHWAVRTLPSTSEFPFVDLAVTAIVSSALVYLWKDMIFG